MDFEIKRAMVSPGLIMSTNELGWREAGWKIMRIRSVPTGIQRVGEN